MSLGPYRINMRKGSSQGWRAESFSYGVYATPRNTNQQEYYRPRVWGIDLNKAIEDYDWNDLLQYSRQLFAQVGNLGWAISQKNLYAVGDAWKPQFQGENKEWGAEAEEWLKAVWMPNCDIRGGCFDFATNLLLTGIAMDVDGDDAMIPAIREDGFPVLKFVSAHQIKNCGDTEVKGKGFDGARLCNGVIVGRHGEFMGIRIAGEEADEHTDIPAHQCQLLFEPDWRNVHRGVPRIGKALMDWFDVQDIDTFLKRGVKLDASIGLLHWTEGGEAESGTDIVMGRGTDGGNTNADPADVKFEKRLGGEVFYMRANKGEKIEGLKSDRPHPNSEAFIERVERRGLNAIGWFYELLDPSAIGGASVRMIQDQARHSIASRQKTLRKRAKRAVQFAIAQGMNIGAISRNDKGGDFLQWDFELPAMLTVDAGYDEDADRENLKIGTTTMAAVAQKKGKWWEDLRTQTRKENENLIENALELVRYAKSKCVDLTFREALDMMRRDSVAQRTEPQDEPTPGQKERERQKDTK
jgi:hypothetical protein